MAIEAVADNVSVAPNMVDKRVVKQQPAAQAETVVKPKPVLVFQRFKLTENRLFHLTS